jgi:hypothetical protein
MFSHGSHDTEGGGEDPQPAPEGTEQGQPDAQTTPSEGEPEPEQQTEGQDGSAQVLLPQDFDINSVPEKFRTEDGKVHVGSLLKSYTEMEKAYSERKPAEAPESYEINYPEIEGFDKETIQQSIPEDDFLLQAALDAGKEAGLTQEQMDTLLNKTISTVMQQEASPEQMQEEVKRLGDGNENKGREVIDRNIKFFRNHLSEEAFNTLSNSMTNAEAVKMADEIRKSVMEPRMSSGAAPVSPSLTEDDLRGKMRQEAYWNPTHPDHEQVVKEVTEGFEKLYPGTRKAG